MNEPELIFGLDSEIAEWVAERIQHVQSPEFGQCVAIGVAKGSKLIAGIVYHQYLPDYANMQLTMAADSPMWATRGVIAGLLHYPFVQQKIWMLYTLTMPDNTKALKVNDHIGLKRKTVFPNAFGRRRHAVVSQMTSPEYHKRYEVSHGR